MRYAHVHQRLRAAAGCLKARMGLDKTIAYTVLARVWTIISNVITVLLMVRFLSPVEQGYYFTFITLVALQVIFELGFSFVILQHAAHESAHLTFLPDGGVEGDPKHHNRLASVFQLTILWYSKAAIALGLILAPWGFWFFSRSGQDSSSVSWHLPWLISVLACVAIFLLNPMTAFLEGCGQVQKVARMRLFQVLANAVFAWSFMVTRHGLFAPGMTMVASALVGFIFLWRRRRFFLGLYRHRVGGDAVSWRREIWPFQWMIAISWLCMYFTLQVFTPMLFHYSTAVEAGKMGMSISIAGYVSAITLAWMTTKAPLFGQLVARRDYGYLDQLFFRTFAQAMTFLALMIASCMTVVLLLDRYFPRLAERIVSPGAFALLLIGTAGSVFVQCIAIYLRSFKREPLYWQSIIVAVLTLLCCRLTVEHMGTMGAALSYLLCTGIVGSISAWWIFRSWRRRLPINPAIVAGLESPAS